MIVLVQEVVILDILIAEAGKKLGKIAIPSCI